MILLTLFLAVAPPDPGLCYYIREELEVAVTEGYINEQEAAELLANCEHNHL